MMMGTALGRPLPASGQSLDAPEAEVIGAGAELTLATRADDVARAVLIGAKKRTAAMDALLLAWLGRVVRRIRTGRVVRHGTANRERGVVVGAVPVARPLPDVAGHVVQAEPVRGKPGDSCQPDRTVLADIADREASLKGVGHPFPVRSELVSIEEHCKY